MKLTLCSDGDLRVVHDQFFSGIGPMKRERKILDLHACRLDAPPRAHARAPGMAPDRITQKFEIMV